MTGLTGEYFMWEALRWSSEGAGKTGGAVATFAPANVPQGTESGIALWEARQQGEVENGDEGEYLTVNQVEATSRRRDVTGAMETGRASEDVHYNSVQYGYSKRGSKEAFPRK
ncbi:hypothetical protein FOZ62_013860, partial [Perkinsus olseni]